MVNGSHTKRNLEMAGARVAFAFGLALWVRGPAPAAPADPRWRFPEATVRAVFVVPEETGESALVEVPTEKVAGLRLRAAETAQGTPLRARRVYEEGPRQGWLVQRPQETQDTVWVLYFGGVETEPDEAEDPRPLRAELLRPSGGNAPNDWPRLRYMLERASPIVVTHEPPHSFDFSEEAYLARRQARRPPGGPPRAPPLIIARLTTWLYCPAEETVRFALDTGNNAFILLDEQLVAEATRMTEPGTWQIGAPVTLRKGLHFLQVALVGRGPRRLRLGILRGAAEHPEPLPAEWLLSSTMVAAVRMERRDQALIAFWEAAPDSPYAFLGSECLFTPVRLFDRSVSRLNEPWSGEWRFPDGSRETGTEIEKIFEGYRAHTVALTVRDRLGFTDTHLRHLPIPNRIPHRYRLAARLDRLPAVVWARDQLHPLVVVQGEAPPRARFQLVWTWTAADGHSVSSEQTFDADALPATMFLSPVRARDVAQLQWSVRHEGHVLHAETVRFGPARAGAVRVVQDTLRAFDGDRHVWVAEMRPQGPLAPPITLDDVFGRVVCVDDTLTPPDADAARDFEVWYRRLGRLLDGPDQPEVRRLQLPSADRFPEAWRPLLKMTLSPETAIRRPTLILVSLALGDLLAGVDAETFERHAAALTDRFLATAPVAWATPPPFPGDIERLREYAAAIQRVARARNVPVADLFTSMVGAGALEDPERFFPAGTLRLTPQAQALAAEVIARTLLEAAGETSR